MSESRALMVEFTNGLDRIGPGLAAALPEHVTEERFRRVVLTAVQQNGKLLAPNLRSHVFMACLKAAQDGLLPDGREGALVPQRMNGTETVQWRPMIGGILKLARNSGEIAGITAAVIYENDEFIHAPADFDRPIHHTPTKMGKPKGNPIGAYAQAKLRDGTVQHVVMDRDQIEKVRAVSAAKTGPWQAWWDQMAEKTVLRRLAKRLPLSTDRDGDSRLRSAIERVDDETALPGTEVPLLAPTSRLDALEAMIDMHQGDDAQPDAAEIDNANPEQLAQLAQEDRP